MVRTPGKKSPKTGKVTKAATPLAKALDPTAPRAPPGASGTSKRAPAVEASVRRAQGSLPAALLRRFVDVDLFSQAAALAFYALLSLAPLLLIVLAVTARWVAGSQDAVMQQIGMLAGADAERIAQTIIANARVVPGASGSGSIAGVWSTVFLFAGATAVFAQLQDVLNKIFRTDATRLPGMLAWLRKRVFSLGLVFALGFLLLISMTVNTVLQLVFARVEWMLPLMASVATWIVYALGFAFMYHYLPDRRVGWLRALGGGAATAVLFLMGRGAIGWYLQQAHPGAAYGSMGALLLALVWIYYAALIVFIGALLTAIVDERARNHAGRDAASRRGRG